MKSSKNSPRSKPSILAASIAGLLAISVLSQGTSLASVSSFLGVAAGDAAPTEATLWTRGDSSSTNLLLQYSTDSSFATGVQSSGALQTNETTVVGGLTTAAVGDHTVKITVTGLAPATVYYYRFVDLDTNATSITGKFKTAPLPNVAYPLHFAFSGDCDGLIRPYALVSQIPGKNLDFFMFDGDTEYETSSSIGSAAVTSVGNIPDPTVTTATATASQLGADFTRKYRTQFLPVNTGGQACLQPFFAGQGNYTTWDNHELGNKQYINGGATAGGGVGSTTGSGPFDFSTGAGVDARQSTNDLNPSGPYMNKSTGFQILESIFTNFQPIKNRGTLSIAGGTALSGDAHTDGTPQLYSATQWGRHAIFVNTDCRSYRDIRMKYSVSGADDNGPRADQAGRTYIGATQLAWLEQTLLTAEQAGTTWKFVNIADPIDQVGPIGTSTAPGVLNLQNLPSSYGLLGNVTSATAVASSSNSTTLVALASGASQNGYGLVAGQPIIGTGIPANTKISAVNADGSIKLTAAATVTAGTTLSLSGATSTYGPVNSDGGKAWFGGYRAERNALLKFIADHQIKNVVFLATDDHQNRVNEITYSPTGQTGVQTSYVKVPYCFEIVCGPLGATGPDLISNHSFSQVIQPLAQSIAAAETTAGIEPIGLGGYPGLHNVFRDQDTNADTNRAAEDFYSPDTFNYNILDVSADGKTLSVTSKGINSTTQNSFLEYDSVNNPEKTIFSFQVDAAQPLANIQHIVVVYQENWSFDGLYGSFPGANGLSNASTASLNQLDRISGAALSTLTGNFNVATRTTPTLQAPNPQPIDTNNGNIVDTRFSSSLNTLQPYDVSTYVPATGLTGDIVHRYWTEMFQTYGTTEVLDGNGHPTDFGNNAGFVTWSDNPGLVMSHFDASNLPEGLLGQQYTMCDNFYHSSFGGSFLNHQFLIAAAAPVYTNMPTINNGTITYLDGTGVFALNTSGSSNGKVIRDGSVTPVAGDVLSNLSINGVGGQTATVGASGTPSDVSFIDGSHFDKHYVVNTSYSRNLAATFGSFATAGTGNVTSGSASVSGVSVTSGGALTGTVGMTVTGSGIPAGAIVIAASASSVTLSQPATASATGVTLSFGSYPASLISSQDNTATPLNIGDLLDNASVSWKWYSGGWNNALASSPSNPLHPGSTGPNNASSLFQWHHQAFAYFEKSKPFDSTQSDGRNPYATAHLQDEANLYTDITNNTLPAVSFVKFLGLNNEHPGYASLQTGQQHVADLVTALQANPSLWANTMVIVTYDEHGGRWDHVTPPVRDLWGPGVRVPALVFSPFAKQGFIDSTSRDTSSILSTIEQRFGLGTLNTRDANAPTFANVLTTAQITRGAFVLNRRTHAFTQSVTITNSGATPIIGPVQLVVDHLSSGTSLQNATGSTTANAPTGSPYVTASTGDIAPGASATVGLQFAVPTSGGISYSARTVTGTTAP